MECGVFLGTGMTYFIVMDSLKALFEMVLVPLRGASKGIVDGVLIDRRVSFPHFRIVYGLL